MSIKKGVEIVVEPTPGELAREVALLSPQDQVDFLNILAATVYAHPAKCVVQRLHKVLNAPLLSRHAAELLVDIGDRAGDMKYERDLKQSWLPPVLQHLGDIKDQK